LNADQQVLDDGDQGVGLASGGQLKRHGCDLSEVHGHLPSILGLTRPAAPQAAYAASKAGLIGLTRDLSQQWAGTRGIRVNAVAAGYFATEMTAAIPDDMLATIAHSSTLGRLGEQHELSAMIVFLASPASGYVTGSTLAIDGGMSGH
jgi:NAD(P)-dependent dehydrogenase (short-subunit alcohol dehydrogenase family)